MLVYHAHGDWNKLRSVCRSLHLPISFALRRCCTCMYLLGSLQEYTVAWMNLVNAKVQLLNQFHSYFTQSMNGNVVAASQWKPKQSFMANSNNVNDVSERSFIQGWSVEPPCYVCVCSYQQRAWAIGWQSLVTAFAQRRESGLPSLLAGSHKLASHTWVKVSVYFTYLSPLGKKPRKQYHRWFYNRGLKLCYKCSFRGEREGTCVVEPSDDGPRSDDSTTQQRFGWAQPDPTEKPNKESPTPCNLDVEERMRCLLVFWSEEVEGPLRARQETTFGFRAPRARTVLEKAITLWTSGRFCTRDTKTRELKQRADETAAFATSPHPDLNVENKILQIKAQTVMRSWIVYLLCSTRHVTRS